jgi:hypothetical protein
MPFINGLTTNAAGTSALVVAEDPDSLSTPAGGFFFQEGTGDLHVSYTAPDTTDTFVRGIAVSAAGAVRCKDTPGAAPAGTELIGGVAVSDIGELLTDTVGPATQYPHGWPVRDDGVLVVTVLVETFLLLESGSSLLLESGSKIIL